MRTQKGGSLKSLEGFRGEITQICLENKDMRGGGGSLQRSNIQMGDRLNFVLLAPKVHSAVSTVEGKQRNCYQHCHRYHHRYCHRYPPLIIIIINIII